MELVNKAVRSYHFVEWFQVPLTKSHDFNCGYGSGTIDFGLLDYSGHSDRVWFGSSEPIESLGDIPPRQGFWWNLGFDIDRDPAGLTVMLPFWLLTVVSFCFTLGPWVSRFKHYSLRTMLIATTLVAVVLGLTVWAAR